jgi:pilus assembly protein CpaB
LRREHLARGDGGFLSLVLQPGTRAIGVKITDEKTAGGFILPNDRVDVLHTVIRDFDGDGTATGSTRTILTNVRVLAIGQTSFDTEKLAADTTELSSEIAPADNGTTLTGQTATLEVTTEQAEALLSAAASGQLSLALRASEDFGLSGLGDLATIEGPKRETPAEQPPVAVQATVGDRTDQIYTPKREVTIISAGKSRQVITEAEEVNP